MTIRQCAPPGKPEELKAHPLAELNPDMSAEQFAELLEDISANGLRVPIVLFCGLILDGRHRLRACLLLGIAPEFAELVGSEQEAEAYARSMETRRHLSRDERAELVRKLRAEGHSLRSTAAKLGTSKSTVARILASGVPSGTPEEPDALEPSGVPDGTPEPDEVDEPDEHDAGVRVRTPEPATAPQPPAKVKGRDGKQYSASKPRKLKPHQKAAKESYGEVLDLVRRCSAALTALMREDSEVGRRFRDYCFACKIGHHTNAYDNSEGERVEAKDELLALKGVAFLIGEACKTGAKQPDHKIRQAWCASVANTFPPNPKNELHRARKAAKGGAA